MKIIIDGINFEKQKGTGIKTYSSSVIKALSEQDAYLELLSEQKIPDIEHVNPADAYLAHALSTGKINSRGVKAKLITLAKSFLVLKSLKKVELLDDSISKKNFYRLGSQDWCFIKRIVFIPSVFIKSFYKSALGFSIKKISLKDSQASIFFQTSPIPLLIKGKRTITTVHDIIPISHPWLLDSNWRLTSKAFINAMKAITEKSDKIICISNYTKNELINRLDVNPAKLHVIYQPCKYSTSTITNLINDVTESNTLEKFNLSPKGYIFFNGAIEPKKNLISLLRAVGTKKNLPTLVIVGGFAWAYNEERALITELKDKVKYLGFLPEIELAILQKNAKCFVFPSIIEGFGLPVVEAMWFGTPCIVSDIPVFREIFAEHATYCDPYSIESISNQIELVCSTQQTEESSRQLINFVQSKYTHQNFSRELWNVVSN